MQIFAVSVSKVSISHGEQGRKVVRNIGPKVMGIVQNLLHNYEGDPTEKFTQALALLFHQMYSSNWAHLKAQNIPFKWGYDTLISNNR